MYVTIDIIVPENSFNKLLLDYSIVNCKQTGHSLIKLTDTHVQYFLMSGDAKKTLGNHESKNFC